MATPTASDNEFPKVILEEVATDGSATVTPSADHRALFLGEDGSLHLKDSSGSVADVGGASPTFNGIVIGAIPVGSRPDEGTSTFGTANSAYACLVLLPGPMKVRAIRYLVSASGSGTVQWGLFHCGSSSSAATKMAGGSGALNSTGVVAIAASGAPVDVGAGSYILITHLPTTNQPTLFRTIPNTGHKLAKSQAAYTWDDTPNFTSGWTDSGVIPNCSLIGDLDASNQW